MNIDNKYIKNNNIKIRNILQIPNAETYDGNCSFYNFRNQVTNYEKFKNKVEQNNIICTHIYGSYWNLMHYWTDTESSRHSFLLLTNNPDLLWYRYDSNLTGSSQNWIYIKKQKISLTKFLNMPNEEINELLKN